MSLSFDIKRSRETGNWQRVVVVHEGTGERLEIDIYRVDPFVGVAAANRICCKVHGPRSMKIWREDR